MQNPGQATENHGSLKRKEPDRGKIEIVPNECKGCGLCISACPLQSIQFSEALNSQGYRPAVFVARSCSGCGICFYVCPEPGAITVYTKAPSTERHVEKVN